MFILTAPLLVTLAKLARPGGLRAVAAESLAVKHQLLILKRSRQRAPNLTSWDRLTLGVCTLFVSRERLSKMVVILKPSTLLYFHQALVKRKYYLLYNSRKRHRPGPKGPAKELIDASVEMKRRNPRFGCRKIAEQISSAFGIEINNKDVVRRILIRYYRPVPSGDGPSWLTVIGLSVPKTSSGVTECDSCANGGAMFAFLTRLLLVVRSRLKSRARLEAEILVLRQQVIVLSRKSGSRGWLRNIDRLIFVWMYRLFPSILNAITVVKPETVIRWHRRGFRAYWRWKSRRGGRPRIDREIRDLIRRMSRENPLWGAPRIHGELLMRGIAVAESTVVASQNLVRREFFRKSSRPHIA